MTETAPRDRPKQRGRGAAPTVARKAHYRHIKNPFAPMKVFSDDRIEAMHEEKGPEIDDVRKAALEDYIGKATAAGGAEPVS